MQYLLLYALCNKTGKKFLWRKRKQKSILNKMNHKLILRKSDV